MSYRPMAWTACAAAVLAWAMPAAAQRFSSPEGPAKPAETTDPAKPPAPSLPGTPAPAPSDDVHRVPGAEGRFTLPLTLYDEKADAAADIQRARALARKDNRRVLAMFGENKCEFCAYLNEMLETEPRIRQIVESEYVVVKVDIGKFDKNIDLANRHGLKIDQPGVGAPALVVIDAVNDQAISVAGGNEMVAKPMMPPNNVFDANFVLNLLVGGRASPQVATVLLLEAQQKAKAAGKRSLVYFHLWGSESSKAFDRFATDPEAVKILEKAFVVRKIDTERHIAGETLIRKLKGSQTASPPWMTVLGADGKSAPEAGAGLVFDPTAPEATVKWLGDAAGTVLTGEDRAALAALLTKATQPKDAAGAGLAPPVLEEAKK